MKVMPTVSVKLTGEQAQVIIDVLVREVQNVRALMEAEYKVGWTFMCNDGKRANEAIETVDRS